MCLEYTHLPLYCETQTTLAVETAQQNRENVVIEMGEQRCGQLTQAEGKHVGHAPEVERQPGTPRTHKPQHQRVERRVENGLYGYAPVAHAAPGTNDTHCAGDTHRHNLYETALSHHQIAKEIGCGDSRERSRHETQEQEPRKLDHLRPVIEAGYERRTEEQDKIDGHAYRQIEPEHGIVVPVVDLPAIDQRKYKAALRQHPGDSREKRQRSHHAIVGRGEQPGQEDAEQQIEQLHHAIAYPAPQQTRGCLTFQLRLSTHITRLEVD